jgi:hypothetical protein
MSNLLSSDILEAQFGPTEVEILRQDAETRIICTKAVRTGQVLEISRVTFDRAGRAAFPVVHQAVMDGASMGKAFRQADIEFRRVVGSAYACDLPKTFRRWFGSSVNATVVDVAVLVGSDCLPYAEILEVYSPLVEWPRSVGQPTARQLKKLGLLYKFFTDESSPKN